MLTACSDQMLAYPVEKTQEGDITEDDIVVGTEDVPETSDTGHLEIDDNPVDEDGEQPEFDTGIDEDTGSEQDPLNEDDTESDTVDEIIEEESEDTIIEEVTEEPDEEPEEEPEEIIDEEPVDVTVVDNFNYSDDFVVYDENYYYAADYGWTFIDSTATNFICGIQGNGFISCSDVTGNNTGLTTSINSHTPFEQVVDLSVTNGGTGAYNNTSSTLANICAINTTGDILCYDNQGGTYSPPKVNEYVDVVVGQALGSSQNDPYVCGLDSAGYVYCFDQTTDGLIHSDSNLYKVIEGKEGPTCGLHDDGITLTCWNLDTASQGNWSNHQIPNGSVWNMTAPAEVLGLAVARDVYCIAYVDPATNLQTVSCQAWHQYYHPNFNTDYCIGNAPHQLYYDFFVNNEDLSNIEIGMNLEVWAYQQHAGIVTQNGVEISWGGSSGPNIFPVNNGYYTGAGCNYYWGN
tara:strand:+ start:51 stop:1433 length:1383 start_codon:yes stop_codon:yes gene_type:complete